jgi:hypothetical protein
MGRRSSRLNADRDGLTVYDLPTAFYMSGDRLCARLPLCPHRGWVSHEASPCYEEPAPDTDQAEYVCRFTEYVALHASQASRIEDFFWPLGMVRN